MAEYDLCKTCTVASQSLNQVLHLVDKSMYEKNVLLLKLVSNLHDS